MSQARNGVVGRVGEGALTCRLARSFWKWGMGREPPELEGGSPRESDKRGGERDTGPSNWDPPTATPWAAAGLLEGSDTSACTYIKHMSDEEYLYFVVHHTPHKPLSGLKNESLLMCAKTTEYRQKFSKIFIYLFTVYSTTLSVAQAI